MVDTGNVFVRACVPPFTSAMVALKKQGHPKSHVTCGPGAGVEAPTSGKYTVRLRGCIHLGSTWSAGVAIPGQL